MENWFFPILQKKRWRILGLRIMKYLILLTLLQVDIEEKIKNAPDKGYEIGVAIGTYLPFVVLVIIAYFMFNRFKNRQDLD